MASKTLSIKYVSDASSVTRDFAKVGTGASTVQGRLASVSASFTKLGIVGPISVALAARAVTEFAADSVRAASDQNEAINKSAVIFEASADTVAAFGETSASAFGLSKTAALEAAAGFGSMLQTAGLAANESANMSVALVRLSADMASFNNQDPSDMLERLRSGLAGEAEPLRKFGVFLSEAAVAAFAYKAGIADVGDALTDAQKVQARYGLILEQTAKQQGDFARTSTGLANQQRILTAEWEDMKAEIGRKLLPIVIKLVGVARDALPVFEALADNLGTIGAALLGYAALKFVPGLLFKIALGLEAVGASTAAGGLLKVAAAASGPAGAVAAITAVGIVWGTAQDRADRASNAIIEGLSGITVAATSTNTAAAKLADGMVVLTGTAQEARDIQNSYANMSARWIAAAEAYQGSLEGVDGALGDLPDRIRTTQHRLTRFANLTRKDFTKWEEEVTGSLDFAQEAFDDLGDHASTSARKMLNALKRANRDQQRFASDAARFLGDVSANLGPGMQVAAEQLVSELALAGREGAVKLDTLAGASTKMKARILREFRESDQGAQDFAAEVADAAAAVDDLDAKLAALPDAVYIRIIGMPSGFPTGTEPGATSPPKPPLERPLSPRGNINVVLERRDFARGLDWEWSARGVG